MDTCGDGQYKDGPSCLSCGEGRYSKAGDSSCSVCKPGTYSKEKSSSCAKCPEGTYSGEGYGSCTACGDGEYSAEGSASCMGCGVNMYKNTSGKCVECGEGTYSEMGSSSCTDCKAGTYRSKGDAKCTPCPDGTFSKPGSSKCSPCGRGSILSLDQTSCTPCERNTTSNPGTNVCEPCKPGYVSEPGGECSQCKSGSYLSITTNTCMQCEVGYIPNETRSNCVSCGENFTSSPGDASCRPLPSGIQECQMPAVLATGVKNNGKCITCVDNSKYNQETGYCDCEPGFTEVGDRCEKDNVKKCPINTTLQMDGLCQFDCPAGEFLNSTRDACIVPNGTRPSKIEGIIEICEPGSGFSDGVYCPADTFWNGTACVAPEGKLTTCGKNSSLQPDGSCLYMCPPGERAENNTCVVSMGKRPSGLDGIAEVCERDGVLSQGFCCPPFKEWNGTSCADPVVEILNTQKRCEPGWKLLPNGSCVYDCPSGKTPNSANNGCVEKKSNTKNIVIGLAIAALLGYVLLK